MVLTVSACGILDFTENDPWTLYWIAICCQIVLIRLHYKGNDHSISHLQGKYLHC